MIEHLPLKIFNHYQVGDKLRQLETSWVGLVSKNYEIEQAIMNMEQEYSYLKGQHQTRTAE